MARALRIEYEDAFYHVTSRGNEQKAIFKSDRDREKFLEYLQSASQRYGAVVHAYCLMTNHYHLFVETLDANLAKGMRQINGVFTQGSNRRHGRTGHLFQGRYQAILVDSDSYLQQLSRYLVLNPVRSGMVEDPSAWPWSSYSATAGLALAPAWLTTDTLLSSFGGTRDQAQAAYRRFVREGIGAESLWGGLNRQIYLGDEGFVARMQQKRGDVGDEVQIPKPQRRGPPPTLPHISQAAGSRDGAIITAYGTGEYSYAEIGAFFGLHFTTVARIVRKARQKTGEGPGREFTLEI